MEWSVVEPVLNATYALLGDGDEVSPNAVVEALGRPPEDAETGRALMYLYDHGFIEGHMLWGNPVPVRIRATTKGLEAASGWPRQGGAEQVELLLRLLDERINSPETPEEAKGRLRQIRDGFAGLARDIAVAVLAALTVEQARRGG